MATNAPHDGLDDLMDMLDGPARNPPQLPSRPSSKSTPIPSTTTQTDTESSLGGIVRRMSPKKQNPPPLPNRQSVISSPVLVSTTLPTMGIARHPDMLPIDESPSSSHPTSSISQSISIPSESSSSSIPITLPPSASLSSTSTTSKPHSNTTTSSTTRDWNFKDRLVVGMDWTRKGKGKMVEGWKQSQSNGTNLNPLSVGASLGKHFSSGGVGGTKLPATILGVRVPKKSGMAFGIPLREAVENCRVPPDESDEGGNDPVIGRAARRWLPGIVYRSLAFLNGAHADEEGLYRVNGGTNQIQQLRLLFDAGMDIDLGGFHASVVDPNSVASLFKSYLREIPESLLSDALAPEIDALFLSALGFTATSSLGRHINLTSTPSNPSDLPIPPALLQSLVELFKQRLPAENYALLRAIAAHLYHLTQLERNKMSLSNLRLILSPTLRLSPGFLFYLVEKREALFREGNDDARRRIQAVNDLAAEREWKERIEGGGRRVRESKSMEFVPAEEKVGFFTRRPSIPPPSQFIAVESEDESSLAGSTEEDVTLEIVAPDEPAPTLRTPISDRFAGTTNSLRRVSLENQPPSPVATTETKPNPIYHRAKGNENGFFVNDVAMMSNALNNAKKPPSLPPRPVAPAFLAATPPSPSGSSRKLSLAEFDQYITHNSSEYSQESSRQGSSQRGGMGVGESVEMGKAATWSKSGAEAGEMGSTVSLPLPLELERRAGEAEVEGRNF